MDFATAVKICLQQKYATFEGRARRSEYWYFTLLAFIVNVVLQILTAILPALGFLWLIVILALFIPHLAVAVRRLHDINRSGWWYLVGLVPLIGLIVLIVWFCKKGDDGANRFGEDPLAGGSQGIPSLTAG